MNTNTNLQARGRVPYEGAGGFTGWVNDLTSRLGRLTDAEPVSVALLAACAAMTAVLVVLVVRTARAGRNRATSHRHDRRGWSGEPGLIRI